MLLRRSDIVIKETSERGGVEADLLLAAKKVIEGSICPQKGEHILLIFDNPGRDLAEGFVEASVVLGQQLTAVYVPYSLQEVTRELTADNRTLYLLRKSTILITAVTDAPETTGFRVSLLGTAVEEGLRCVHMPGVNEEVFISSTLGIHFPALHQHAEQIASALTSANTATIKTRSSITGEEHTLTLMLTGRTGHADGGLVRSGEIINIPTGEAYIAPVEGSAEGSICIAGSFPECELGSGREVVIVFSRGAIDLKRSAIPRDEAGAYCRRLLESALAVDAAGLRLGEFGIGLNPAIAGVNGMTILDEKAFGTAHVAIGSNKPFGGEIVSPYHYDLVFFPTSIVLDHSTVSVEWNSNASVV